MMGRTEEWRVKARRPALLPALARRNTLVSPSLATDWHRRGEPRPDTTTWAGDR